MEAGIILSDTDCTVSRLYRVYVARYPDGSSELIEVADGANADLLAMRRAEDLWQRRQEETEKA